MGVFDGVHRGHRVILKEAVGEAKRIKGTSIALTFWPHPQKEGSLYSLEHRLRLIAALGIDVCIVINFNRQFAGISAENFIRDILIGKIRAEYVYVGKNFRFGKGAKGDYRTLKNLSKAYGFKLKLFKVIKINHRPISSTLIRSLIRKGKLIKAGHLLMRPVNILGTVIRGRALGRRIGFPTANIDPHHEVIPPTGVYAVRAIYAKRKYRGICNIGTRPTLSGKKKISIEVYIYNFKKNIYGKDLEVQFIKKIREERKFPCLASLVRQIKKDIASTTTSGYSRPT